MKLILLKGTKVYHAAMACEAHGSSHRMVLTLCGALRPEVMSEERIRVQIPASRASVDCKLCLRSMPEK